MEVCDTPTKVLIKGKPITTWMKNRNAQLLCIMFRKIGYAESDLSLVCDKTVKTDQGDKVMNIAKAVIAGVSIVLIGWLMLCLIVEWVNGD